MNASPAILQPSRPFEKLLLQIERQPFAAAYRVAIGFLMVPLYQKLIENNSSATLFVIYFLGVLLLIRLVPFVIRKVLPFSREIQALWFSRRNLGKEYDSFQWRKLFWIGLGMAIYMVAYADRENAHSILAAICIGGGAAAQWIWRRLPMASQAI
jgi:hypothetical protein